MFIFLGCPPGYTGVDCIFPCGYPNYGIGCENTCKCTEDMCDVTFGCKSVSKPGICIVK